jgi:fumarylacetoacetate (FAA) hydrolase
MKFASLNNQTKDGLLCLVSRDLKNAYSLENFAPNLQYALEHWDELTPELEKLYQSLNQNKLAQAFAFEALAMLSPLPRSYQWADGSAFLHHVKLVRQARGAEMPEQFLHDPLMYQGGSDQFLAPCEPIPLINENYGLDFEAEVAVITDHVPMGASPKTCQTKIRLLMLVNDVTLRELIPQELAKGFGFFQSKPSSSFSPVAVTPDELGDAWDGQRLHLPLLSYYNHQLFGQPNAGIDMHFSFPELIAHAAKTRPLSAGSIIGSGTVSNNNPEVGSSCIVERRMIEIIQSGKPSTPYMKAGDWIKIEMKDAHGQSIFGAIQQTVKPYSSEAKS